MKILPDEVFTIPSLPDIEALASKAPTPSEIITRSLALKTAIMENGARYIYDEDKFKAFINYVATQEWVPQPEIDTCLADLEKDSPQALLNLWIKTEGTATSAWGATFCFEIGSGDFNFLRNYVLASVIRSITSLLYSKGVVDHRYFTAGFEAIPHIGRIAPLIALAEEHPELVRMLWSYKGCRKHFKHQKDTQDDKKIEHKFNRSRDSKTLKFMIAPKEFTQDTLLEWHVQSKTIQVAQSVAQTLGVA